MKESKRALLDLLIGLRRDGKQVVGYGAPGKGNTLLNYCGIRTDLLTTPSTATPTGKGSSRRARTFRSSSRGYCRDAPRLHRRPPVEPIDEISDSSSTSGLGRAVRRPDPERDRPLGCPTVVRQRAIPSPEPVLERACGSCEER